MSRSSSEVQEAIVSRLLGRWRGKGLWWVAARTTTGCCGAVRVREQRVRVALISGRVREEGMVVVVVLVGMCACGVFAGGRCVVYGAGCQEEAGKSKDIDMSQDCE